MKRMRWILLASMTLIVVSPVVPAQGQGLDVEIWTDRGNGAVYRPGDAMEVQVRTSTDAYLLVYELDVEGRVNLLFPYQGNRGYVEGRTTLRVPSEQSNLDLVVEGPVGEGYLVAVVSTQPFKDLPWYLKPYDVRAEGTGYEGAPDEEEGVTREGRIVGDPFVAMERIRRRVLSDADDPNAFATAYTNYYVHHEVRYPRYLCNDCHRPSYWGWWSGFDPYYAHCSVFDFRVNWHWGWGPSYWYGAVPYYYYVYRVDCPPRYRGYAGRYPRHSSWEGWGKWSGLWGRGLRRIKLDPPPGYIPPNKYDERTAALPPGFFSSRDVARGRQGGGLVPITREPRGIGERVPPGQPEPREGPSRSPGQGRSGTWRDGGSATPRSTPGAAIQGRTARPNHDTRQRSGRSTSARTPSVERPREAGKDAPRGVREAPQRVEPRRDERREARSEGQRSGEAGRGRADERETRRRSGG